MKLLLLILDQFLEGVLDLTKARKMFNFNPTISWKEALYNSLEWYSKFYRENNKRFFTGPHKYYNK